MDDFLKFLNPFPRHFPSRFQVMAIGYFKSKDSWYKLDPQIPDDSFTFSFILRGEGECRMDGRRYSIIPPCVILQLPGKEMNFGPHKTWEEIYINYSIKDIVSFNKIGFASPGKPIWRIGNIPAVFRYIDDLMNLLKELNSYGNADMIDRICESMILESLISGSPIEISEKEENLQKIILHVEKHFLEDIDFNKLALSYGFSPQNFRRYWEKSIKSAPYAYVMQLKMRQARRLLVETKKNIGQIATDLNFSDPLYFSKKFRKIVGETASEYRQKHHYNIPS